MRIATSINKLSLWVSLAPYLISAFVCFFGIFAVGLLLVGRFESPLLIIASAISLALSILLAPKPSNFHHDKTIEGKTFDLLIIAGALAWVVFNAAYATQSVFMKRDPALYTIGAKQLTETNKTDIKVVDLGLDVNTARTESNGVYQDLRDKSRNTLQIQGMHLLPTLLSAMARLFGDAAIYKANVLFGGLAILSLYAFAKLMTKPRWAALGAAIFASSLPLIYFSRDTYTEPLAAFLALSGLLWVTYAYTQNLVRKYWFTAGILIGAGVMARPDAYMTVIATVIAIFICQLYAGKTGSLNVTRQLIPFAAGAFLPAAIAWIDISELTRMYFYGHGDEVKLQLLLLLIVLVFSTITILLNNRYQWFSNFLRKPSKSIAIISLLLFPILGVLLSIRPIFYKDINTTPTAALGQTYLIQQRTGDAIEARTYAEMTTEWLSWYLGELIVIMGFIGLGLATYYAYLKKEPRMIFGVSVVTISAALYLVAPHITPDQIWAMRRFVPVIMPGLIVFGVYAIGLLFDKFWGSEKFKNTTLAIYVLLFAYLISQPLLTSRPFIRVNEKPGHVNAINQLCAKLPDNSLVIWLGSTLELDAVHTTRVFCGVDSIGYDYQKKEEAVRESDMQKIKENARKKGLMPILAIHGSQKEEMNLRWEFSPVSIYNSYMLEQTVSSPPRDIFLTTDSIEIAELE